ncbi:MAG: CHY zinc finger protein [Anaerobacillus sp.]
MRTEPFDIRGKLTDDETRCEHYHSEQDIIAIKFYCCRTYYSCISCHLETANHPVRVWPVDKFNEEAILCGKCKTELTIREYLSSNRSCPCCHAAFNDGCKLHHHLYFEMK